MITARSEKTFLYAGLSSDTKPTAYVGNGSIFIEMDTSKTYIYNEASKAWSPFDLGSGGGGGTTYTAGENITISEDNVISAQFGLSEQLVAGLNVGGVEKGDTFAQGTNIEDVIKAILTEISPVEGTIYYGALNTTSPDVQDLHSVEIPAEIKAEGITLDLRTTGKQYQCMIYPKELGLLTRIIENGLSEFNVLGNFTRSEMIVSGIDYYCYCTNELALEESDASYAFYYN